MNWQPIILSLQLAIVTTLLLFFISLPIVYWLQFTKSKFKPVIESLISLPLVLPPTVIGFYLLVVFSPQNTIGAAIENIFGLSFLFSFQGLVLASILYSLPFMVQPIYSGLQNIPGSMQEASYVLGKSKAHTFRRILLPMIKPSILTGLVLSFAHTIGEFGVVLMIGGNIPGKTRVASIAIYDEVEAMNYGAANHYALFLIVFSFLILLAIYSFQGSIMKRFTI